GYLIPWFPDLLSGDVNTITGNPVREAFGRQIAFLRAIAAGAPHGSALQLRFISRPHEDVLQCVLVGASADAEDARVLSSIVVTALPPEVPLADLGLATLEQVLGELETDGMAAGDAAEIRRGVEPVDPTVRGAAATHDAVVLPWNWSAQAMLASLALLRRQPSIAHLVVHIERAELPTEIASFLQDEVERLIGEVQKDEERPALVATIHSYRRWLRLLPKGCLDLRVLVASRSGLVPGLAQSLSTDLTRSFEIGADGGLGAAEVVVPRTGSELDACAALLDELLLVPWRQPVDPALGRLAGLFDPLEANAAFRIPITPGGGLPGIATRRLSAIAGGVVGRTLRGDAIPLGVDHSGGPYVITAEDLNQHVLVAGQPGFGKSSTVRLLLRRLLEQRGTPFLVIDPAKDDYGALFDDLVLEGHEVAHVRFDLERVAFNPLAPPSGVGSAAHAGRVLAAFDAAWSLSAVYPLGLVMMQRALRRAYLTAAPAAPTLVDLYRHLADHIRRAGLTGEARANVEGSLLGRLEVLITTSVGRTLNGGPEDGIDWDHLTSRPTLIEMGSIAGPAERALLFALLIGSFVGYREANPLGGGLGHVTVLEEAHRVLRRSPAADAGVEVFIDGIAELRGAGQGFVIVDQTPGMLHPGVLKLTGTKLAHRLADAEERHAVAQSMVLTERQASELARLAPRRVVAYTASGDAASLLEVDEVYSAEAGLVRGRVPLTTLSHTPATEAPFPCVDCPVRCTGSGGLAKAPAYAATFKLQRPTPAPAELWAGAAKLATNQAEMY
ncbi:ATP-binding protein, partial [bacterium]